MPLVLRRELLSYGSCLVVLKTLEAKHFLVELRAQRGRATQVPTISADMRRRFNQDHLKQDFEDEFPNLLTGVAALTTLPWQTKTQLIDSITKQVYRGMHDNLERQHQHFDRFRSLLKKQNDQTHGVQPRCTDYTLKFHHLSSVIKDSWYYALPSRDISVTKDAVDAQQTYEVFQVLALTPGLRQYIQRSAYMTEDASWLC